MALTEAQNFAAVRTELDDVFYQNFDYDARKPSMATARSAELFKPIQISNAAYIQEIFAGSPLFSAVGEIAEIPQSQPKIANKLTVYVVPFAEGVRVSKDYFDDNMHALWTNIVADFALKARVSQDANAFKIFRGAFTTTLTADGQPLCGTHPLINGGTTVNTFTGASSALSSSAINTLTTYLGEQPDQSGVILGASPEYLVVPQKLFYTAIQETQSALIADNANNAVNVWRSVYGLTVLYSPYLGAAAGGSDTAWFLLTRNHRISRLIRQGVQTALTDWTYSTNRTYFYQANFREEVFVADYIGVAGSQGV